MGTMGWSYLTRADRMAIRRGIRDGRAYGGPYHAEIHPADRCNIDCFFCSTAAIRGTDEIPHDRMEQLAKELQQAGAHSIRLSGGGEPLFHRRITDFIGYFASAGIRIENVTTNAVLLRGEVAKLLLEHSDEVSVSINTGDEETYASMMKTTTRNFGRVVENTKAFAASRKKRRPTLTLQFFVWKGNFTTIPTMYALAREIDADRILFNGLSGLLPDQKMTAEETEEMLRLYAEVLRVDEYRRIASIASYEQDITAPVEAIADAISRERRDQGIARRALRFLRERDSSVAERLEHHFRFRRQRKLIEATRGLRESCVIGWYSMLIRTTGKVAPCCIIQDNGLGNVYQQSVSDIWHGADYAQFRQELSRILARGPEWQHDPAADRYVGPLCGVGKCPMATFMFAEDVPFRRDLDSMAWAPAD